MVGYVRAAYAMMLCVANMIIYGLKVNIATAIIGMTKRKPVKEGETAPQCPQFTNDHTEVSTIQGPFEWTPVEQGLVVSIYFAGYLLGMFPSGYCADRFNSKWVLIVTVFFNAVTTILLPLTARAHLHALYALRFFTGLVSSSNLPVMNVLMGKWVVYEEKGMWAAIIYAGMPLGTVISILTTAQIISAAGWEAVFYVHGTLPLIWCVIFILFFADNPESQKFITEEEREYICGTYAHRKPFSENKPRVPWKAIFTSVPFWALILTNTLGNFSWYFLLTTVPLYMNHVLKFNIKANAGITCFPYLIIAILNPCLGKLLDWGRTRGIWKMTVARKIAVTISCVPTAVLILIIAYIGCHRLATTILLCINIVVAGTVFIGHLCNQNDLSPNFAGILMGITNTPGTIPAFVIPALTGHFTKNEHTFGTWRNIFWIIIICQISAWLIFTIFGSGNIQPWNEVEQNAVTEEVASESRNRENRRQ
ncbi:sialin-like [Neodiprion virginianus]|uniref:sialin-like n=1 Tax=Neodiprion virginianus TaxID=2961670 RepID=UPI001EE753EB|nr:sialin-like [Neodiprion virginianus]